MTARITKDTRLCMSLAARPGNTGTRFHNYLYEKLGLDFVYKAFTTTDLPAAIGGVRALGVRGCAVSMPFKEAVIPLLDRLDASAQRLQSVNTIVNDDGVLTGFNTDYLAVRRLLARHGVPRGLRVALRGSGGMARAVLAALVDSGLEDGTLVARNPAAGQALARLHGWHWQPESGGLQAGLLVNATPLGMAGSPDAGALAFDLAQIAGAAFVFDVVAQPVETPLVVEARRLGRVVIDGGEVIALQAAAQFFLYTGVDLSDVLVSEAAAYSQA
ncbi:shikimate 5-dehydrogenase [Xylophilus sp. Kf1]|nr:shikimate 5-dehydrogenase [Xylophilus sp. Kf1]